MAVKLTSIVQQIRIHLCDAMIDEMPTKPFLELGLVEDIIVLLKNDSHSYEMIRNECLW